jgi:hypothetical protein
MKSVCEQLFHPAPLVRQEQIDDTCRADYDPIELSAQTHVKATSAESTT